MNRRRVPPEHERTRFACTKRRVEQDFTVSRVIIITILLETVVYNILRLRTLRNYIFDERYSAITVENK